MAYYYYSNAGFMWVIEFNVHSHST